MRRFISTAKASASSSLTHIDVLSAPPVGRFNMTELVPGEPARSATRSKVGGLFSLLAGVTAGVAAEGAAAARSCGRLAKEIAPVTLPQPRGEAVVVAADEHPRPDTTLDKLGRLPTPFRQDGTVTAGNASGVNDGAAALLVASEAA